MEKYKEKLEKLRLDGEAAVSRAEKAETELKEAQTLLAKREAEVQNLSNKSQLLQEELLRQERRVEEVKQKQFDGEKGLGEIEGLNRKVALLERQVDEKESARRDAVEKSRTLELTSETADRKVRLLENEKSDLEKKLSEMTVQYNAVKDELAETLKNLEDL